MFKLLSQPDQSAYKTFSLPTAESGCCGDAQTGCKYVAAPTDEAMTGITVKDRDGNNKALTFSASASGPAAVKAAIEAVFAAELYYDDDDSKRPGVVVTDEGATLSITIISEFVVVSMQHSGGPTAFTETCTEISQCSFTNDYAGGTGDILAVDGVNATLGALVHGTQTAANVKSALEGAANWPANAVATVVDNGTTFDITIVAPGNHLFVLAGEQFDLSDGSCGPDYV